MTLSQYAPPGVCAPDTNEGGSMDYAQGFSAIVVLALQVLKLLALVLLLTVAFVLWVWSISFQAGRLFRRWIRIEEPGLWQIIYRFGEIWTFPLVVIGRWSRQKVKELLKIDLPMLPEPPPTNCKELLSPASE